MEILKSWYFSRNLFFIIILKFCNLINVNFDNLSYDFLHEWSK